ncbi:MAG: N-6 DNA methylase [Methylococcaceae bacterium]
MDYSQIQTKIKNCRDILVGVIPSPEAQVQHITVTLIYKFMNDMDKEAQDKFHAPPLFFTEDFIAYSWDNILSTKLGNHERLELYVKALENINNNPRIPPLFRDVFKGAFLPYRNPDVLTLFLRQIDEFIYDGSETLGDAFEHLLSIMSSQGDAGQFRTPRHIIDFIVKIINPQKDETILDPACGTAGFLIYAYIHILKANQFNKQGDLLSVDEKKALSKQLIGYDISPDMTRLSKVNMYLHGFKEPKIFEYDTLSNQDRWQEKFDVILANPPFMTPKGGIKPHSAFSIHANRAEVLFVDYIAEHLTRNGRAGIVVPEGIIFQSAKTYKALRQLLVDGGYLWAVISLPAGIFQPYSGVKTSILLLNKPLAKVNKSIAFIKINHDGFDLGAQRRESAKNDLPQALNLLERFAMGEVIDDPLWQLVPKAKIAESGDYNLTGERYRAVKARDNGVYPLVKLGEVCDILDSLRKPVTKSDRKTGEYPYYGATGIVDYVDNYIFDEKLVLIGEDGAKWNIGDKTAFIINGKTWVNNHAHVLRPKRELILDELLVEIINGMNLLPFITGVTVPKLNQEKLRQIEIPLPPLEIQNAIVAEIEQWQKVIDGAKKVVANYRPVIDIKPDWEMVKLGEAIKLSSGRFLPKSNQKEGVYLVYGGNGYFGRHNEYFTEEKTLIIGRVGAYCGAIHITDKNSWITDNALYVTEKIKPLNLIFLKTVLEQINLNQYAKVGGQPSINQSTIYEIEIPLPPLEIQNAIVEQIEKERASVESCKTLIGLFEDKIKAKIAQVWGE